MDEDTRNAKITLEVMVATMSLWTFGGQTHKRPKLQKTEGQVGAVRRAAEEDRHECQSRRTHWKCTRCRARTRGNVIPKIRSYERCKGLHD